MEHLPIEHEPIMDALPGKSSFLKLSSIHFWLIVSLALFWVIFLWGFWDKSVRALGLNMTIFCLGFLAIFCLFSRKISVNFTRNLFWIIPLSFISLSFFLYENPWLKIISLFVLPGLFAFFYNYSMLKDRRMLAWNLFFAESLAKRIFSFGEKIDSAFRIFFDRFLPNNIEKKTIIKKVLFGLLIFLPIAVLIIIPLLASADSNFADKMEWIWNHIGEVLSFSLVMKILLFLILAIVFLSWMLAWNREFFLEKEHNEKRQLDAIVSGTVMGGLFGLYLIFIFSQLEQLWVEGLPINFKETESLVKAGFWQLFALSGINVFFYFLYYRRTVPFVQHLLIAFTIASLLILLSAGQRMSLYVFYYGFSYEKFFAFYTVLYAVMLFVWLIICLFLPAKKDIVKFVVVSFMWMYSLATIFPVEQFIFYANTSFSQYKDSRIDLYEMKILSGDVLELIEGYRDDEEWQEKWRSWIEMQKDFAEKKIWYESNLGNLIGKI